MAVHYNNTDNKIVIEIESDLLNAPNLIQNRKQAILELLEMAEEGRLEKDTRYWALQLINDLEPTPLQYKNMLNASLVESLKTA